MGAESLGDRVVRLFRDFRSTPPPASGPRFDHLPFSLHVVASTRSLELFRAGPLDPFRFYQRTHASPRHSVEYVVCVPDGGAPDDHRAYAVVRFRPVDVVPLVAIREVEAKLHGAYGTLAQLPPARSLLERPISNVLTDEDPPEGPNRVRAPERERKVKGRFSAGELLDVIRRELAMPEVISWIEGAFSQPARAGEVEHRYYLDARAGLWVVRDHYSEGKTLYRAETSAHAPRPVRS